MSDIHYNLSLDQRQLTIFVEGEFSYDAYDSFMAVLHELGPELKQVILDFSAISRIDAYGVGLLLLLIDYIGGRLSLSVVNSSALTQQTLLNSHLDRYIQLPQAV